MPAATGRCAVCSRAIRLVDGRWLHVWVPLTDIAPHDAAPAPE